MSKTYTSNVRELVNTLQHSYKPSSLLIRSGFWKFSIAEQLTRLGLGLGLYLSYRERGALNNDAFIHTRMVIPYDSLMLRSAGRYEAVKHSLRMLEEAIEDRYAS